MPGGDGTGPRGMGRGRGAGYRGGRGAGGQGGRGNRPVFDTTGQTARQRAAADASELPPETPPSPDEELQTLKTQVDAAAAELERMRRRIDELTPKADES